MYIKHVANNILLDYTYSTFKCLENNVYGLKMQTVFQLNQNLSFIFLSFFGYVKLNLRCHNKYNFGVIFV